jgi:hypothetical protein
METELYAYTSGLTGSTLKNSIPIIKVELPGKTSCSKQFPLVFFSCKLVGFILSKAKFGIQKAKGALLVREGAFCFFNLRFDMLAR